MSGKQYSNCHSGVQIKLEKLSEFERSSAIQDSTSNDGDDVQVLPTPEKVKLVVSLDDDEGPPGPRYVHNCSDADRVNVANQSENEEVDVAVGPSKKKQKLMIKIKNPSSSSKSYNTRSITNRKANCSTLNDSRPLPMVLPGENSSLTVVGSRSDDNDDNNGSASTLLSGSASTNDEENIDEFVRGSPMDILEPCSSSSIPSTTPVPATTNSNDISLVKIVDEKIVFDVKSQEELNKKIESLAKLPDPSSVKIIEITSDPEDNLFISYKQIKALYSMSLPLLEKLHIALNFHENITAKLFEDLLVKFSDNLVHFHVTGGYIGVKKEEIIIRMPPLPRLEHFGFQTIYNFDTNDEVIEPVKVVQDDGVDLIVLEDSDDDEIAQKEAEIPTSNGLFRITLFLPRLKCLKEIILGNYIKVITSDPMKSTDEEFSFEYFKALEVFKVGSFWNDIVHFLPPKLYKVVLKEIQFPDFLKDLTVIRKIAEIFPKLEIVHLNLPSPFVLQEFIQIYSKLELKGLFLKTWFLQEDTDVKIFCGLYKANDGEEERKIRWFGVHGNLVGFEKSEKELEKNQKGKSKKKNPKKMLGLGSLKKIENIEFHHIPRKLYFTKFKKTIGFEHYSAGFPGRDHVPNFIQELRMLKNLKYFEFPKVHKDLKRYLANRFGGVGVIYDYGIYPKLLKVNKTDEDGGKKMKSEVKKENNTS